MKKRIILSLILAVALLLPTLSVYAGAIAEPEYYSFADGMGKSEIPYGEDDTVGTIYGHTNFKMMNETQAAAAGVPEGYSGWVLALDNKDSNGSISIGIDLTGVKVRDIEQIRVRVWCPTGTKQGNDGGVRFTGNGKSSWNMLESPSALTRWIDITLKKSSFDSFDYDGDGYCNPVNFCFRHAKGTAYIDHIIVDLKEADVTPPIITYDGETEIITTAGRTFEINATAFDERDDKNIAPEYIYSEGAVDENGLLIAGEHTCTVRFTDASGNFSEINITLKVEAKDTVAPVLSWAPDKIYANTGARPLLDITAIDDKDGEVEVTAVWSAGALERGRLCTGNHTLTLTAIDGTGNKVEKVIDVIVTYGMPSKG